MDSVPLALTLAPSPAPERLGFHVVEGGATMSVWAPHATQVELCLFDEAGVETRHGLVRPTAGLWHGFVPGVVQGQHYGLRAHGAWSPDDGLRFNPSRLLLDPYARGIEGRLPTATNPGFGAIASTDDPTDSAPVMPRGVLLSHGDLPGDAPGSFDRARRPRVRWEDTVVYEAHVKGLTLQMPDVPEDLRGTYAALGHDAVIAHLARLGVTTLELLPIHAHANEPRLERMGLSNYWGYNTLGFFAPHADHASAAARAAGPGAVLDELRTAVDRLHLAGIEVVLDVVYNHTCEGGVSDTQVSWRGLANRGYYRRLPGLPGRLFDTTGTGNSLDFYEPRVVQMALDSLRYWLGEVGVDGFRFDLAATLGRTNAGFDPRHPFLVGITTDPVIGASKLIAEPWDIGPGGWQTGGFPAPMAEWNDRFRDTVRGFWLADPGGRPSAPRHGVRDLANRLAGSSDVFGRTDPPLTRGPVASINFVACHDGFTLTDLTAFDEKHNETNGENGRDGTTTNHSWNHGVEGLSDDPDILAARRRSARNLIGTLLLSAGVPMLGAGDELGRTQRGNNNAYCHDDTISWLDWNLEPWQDDIRATVAYLVDIRRANPVLRPSTFYEGRDHDPSRRDDLGWFTAAGEPSTDEWWHNTSVRAMQMMRSLAEGADALVLVNGARSPVEITIPADGGPDWRIAWDSVWESPTSASASEAPVQPGSVVTLPGLSLRLYLGD